MVLILFFALSYYPMRSLFFLCFSAIALCAADRPNVLFIAVDDLVPTLGVYGDSLAQTPAIDTLASQGTTFLNHHVQWSVCGPSRAALSTSLMPEETNVMGFRAIRHPDYLPDVITLPQHFRNQGYETACSGKFHDNRTVGTPGSPLTNDQFDDGNDVDDPLSWSIPWTGGGSGYSPSGKPAVDYANDTDADFIDYDILSNGLDLIETLAAGDKPFFLAVGFKKPHLGFHAPTKYWDLYDTDGDGNYDDDFPLEDFTTADPSSASTYVEAMLDFNNEILGYEPFDTTGLPTESEARELRHGYYACVSFIDNLVGQLVDKLATTDDPVQLGKKMSETTIIVLWGDHGFYLGQQSRWAKHANLEQATSAPLIIYDPRSPTSGAKTKSPANSIDLYPTLCELAGLPIPEHPLSNTQATGRPLRGRSLVPVLEDPSVSVNGGATIHHNTGGAYGYAYRTERFRFIEWVNSGGSVVARDLYDYGYGNELEHVNLATDPDYAGIVYELSTSLRADPATQGMARLQSSSAAPKPSGVIPIPGLRASGEAVDQLRLAWPVVEGVSYRVVNNSDLSSNWTPVSGYSSTTQGSANLAISPGKEFFLIEIDDNLAPRFFSDPILKASATSGLAYMGESLSGDAIDPDFGDTLTFAKVSGADWLSIASNGTLSGTPDSEGADEGALYFMVSATDNHGATREAKLQISVVASSGGPVSTTLSFDPVAEVFLKESEATTNFEGNKWLELSDNTNGTKRYSFVRFDVSGLPIGATITKVKLFVTPNSEGATQFPEYGDVGIYDVSDDSWDPATVTWSSSSGLVAAVESPHVSVATLQNSTGSSDVEQSVDLTTVALLSGNGLISLGLRTQDTALGRFSSSNHSTEPGPRLEVTYTE